MKNKNFIPILQALVAAALFGASAPLAKLLLGEIHPIPLAGFLYLGSGCGLLVVHNVARLFGGSSTEAHLTRNDLPWLAGAILAGGIMAPIILMFSLRSTPAATAALLLNFEAVSTGLIAFLLFRESIGVRTWVAISCITSATILLSLNPAGGWGFSVGALGVLAACVLWGVDNNLTRNISAKDPMVIVTWKGLCAGGITLLMAQALGIEFPDLIVVLECMLLGLMSYGASIVLFILAMRSLGATRTTALFGSAPFVGAILSWLIFRGALSGQFFIGVIIMIVGAVLLLGEKHIHIHDHCAQAHDHRHRHDDNHHTHVHPGEVEDLNSAHSHRHTHQPLQHGHAHTPDTHHRHGHSQD